MQFQIVCGAAVGEVLWQEAVTLSLGSKNVLAMSRTAVLTVWNALECCPSANVFFAAKARAQDYGILPRPVLIWGRQGLSAFECSLDTQQTVAHIR